MTVPSIFLLIIACIALFAAFVGACRLQFSRRGARRALGGTVTGIVVGFTALAVALVLPN